jgi:hypothetical protein
VSAERRREEILARVPRWYNGYVHLAAINVASFAAMISLARRVESPGWRDALMVPAFFVFANLVEWLVHRGPMHHPWRGLGWLYRRHALTHHVYFTSERMELRAHRELQLVLFPPLFFPALLVATLPLPLALWALFGWNLAVTFWLSAFAYYLVYEWFHTVHHWPRESRIGRSAFARLVRRHHTRHHDMRRMTSGNFNVSFPLWDWVLGTTLRPGVR